MMKVIKWILIILGLILFNFFIIEYLLRVNGIIESFQESKVDKELKRADSIIDYSSTMESRLISLQLENKINLNSLEKYKRVPYIEVESYNPYPPIIRPFKSDFVLYRKDSVVKQITILSGESDTTPSVLVNKSRGGYTGGGDYFVTYIFYQNDINKINGVVNGDYDKINWYSFRGGSYNGFEEAWLIVFTFLEILFLIAWSFIKKRKAK